jgi:hypothetical protein
MADLGEIMRGEAAEYLRTHGATPVQHKAIRAVTRCRTREAGTVTVKCGQCDDPYRLFCSCRNGSCPSCQGEARAKWLAARFEEILPVDYLHVVFTTPSELNVLALFCPREFYEALIRAAGQAVIDVGRFVLHAQLGCITEIQTWTQLMALDPHAHCAVPAGGFSNDGARWISFQPKDLPAAALAKRFRSLLCKRIRKAAQQGKFKQLPSTISVEQLLAKVIPLEWKVYAEPAFGGPQKLFEYLSRYVYRVAITNDRIESYENRQVTFRRRGSRHGKQVKRSTMHGQEFVRRWLLHVPPRGFVRIRSYGFLGNRNRKRNLERARQLLGSVKHQTPRSSSPQTFQLLRLCPKCSEANRSKRTLHFAPPPEVASQITLSLRPPPIPPVAA